jgi:hypothetical protein
LGLRVVWAAVTIAGDVSGFVVLSPFYLRHVDPSLRLGLDFNRWGSDLVNVSGTSYHRSVALSSRSMSFKLLQPCDPLKDLILRNNKNPGLNRNI